MFGHLHVSFSFIDSIFDLIECTVCVSNCHIDRWRERERDSAAQKRASQRNSTTTTIVIAIWRIFFLFAHVGCITLRMLIIHFNEFYSVMCFKFVAYCEKNAPIKLHACTFHTHTHTHSRKKNNWIVSTKLYHQIFGTFHILHWISIFFVFVLMLFAREEEKKLENHSSEKEKKMREWLKKRDDTKWGDRKNMYQKIVHKHGWFWWRWQKANDFEMQKQINKERKKTSTSMRHRIRNRSFRKITITAARERERKRNVMDSPKCKSPWTCGSCVCVCFNHKL